MQNVLRVLLLAALACAALSRTLDGQLRPSGSSVSPVSQKTYREQDILLEVRRTEVCPDVPSILACSVSCVEDHSTLRCVLVTPLPGVTSVPAKLRWGG